MIVRHERQKAIGMRLIPLDHAHNFIHHFDGFDGVFSNRRLARKHDCIGTCHGRPSDIGDLGSRRHARANHRFEHLRRHHDRFIGIDRHSRELALNERNFFFGHLDAQIATRNHYCIRGLDNRLDILNRLGLFDLRHHRYIDALRPYKFLDFEHFFGRAHKRYRNVIDAQFAC